jgi:integrase
MSLYRRKGSPYWWARFTHNGKRLQQSTGTSDRQKAQEYHDKLKSQLWEQDRLGRKPARSWNDAVVRWLRETGAKASHKDDIQKLRWLDRHLRGAPLDRISRDQLASIADTKAKEASETTANRYMALARAILRKSALEWEWIDRVPKVRMFKERPRRVRWVTREQANQLLALLPVHLADMARFSLATGLRQANVLQLEWSQLDMPRKVAWIHADQAKARKAIGVPLNDEAVAVVRRQLGKHQVRVFTFQDRPVASANTKVWRRAVKAAGLGDFRWHDLRHTWASWHAQAGTSSLELQEMGGWETPAMVRRYAHLSPEHLATAAARIEEGATKLATVGEEKRA